MTHVEHGLGESLAALRANKVKLRIVIHLRLQCCHLGPINVTVQLVIEQLRIGFIVKCFDRNWLNDALIVVLVATRQLIVKTGVLIEGGELGDRLLQALHNIVIEEFLFAWAGGDGDLMRARLAQAVACSCYGNE